MKKLRLFHVDTSFLPEKGGNRIIRITGDAGSVFSLTITDEDTKYYNFKTNAFQTTQTRLVWAKIPRGGSYTVIVRFPPITDDDTYTIKLYAEDYFDTKLSSALMAGSNNYLSTTETIYQYLDTDVTFSLTSPDAISSYNALPSDTVLTGKRSGMVSNTRTRRVISWPITLRDNNFSIVRQPVLDDFETDTTQTTNGSGSSSTSMILDDISTLVIGMAVKTIESGTVSESPKITAINRTTKTATLSVAQTWADGKTITFTGYGSAGSKAVYNTSFKVTDFKVTIEDVTTTTTAAVSSSTTVPVTSIDGIKVGAIVSGIGISCTTANPTVANMNGLSLILSDAQTLEDGQTLTFEGSSRSATVSFLVEITSFGETNFTTTLNLDNILIVS